MAFTTINLTEPVVADELAAYGAKPGQHDCYPMGIAVFGVASSAVTAGTNYVDPTTGALTDSSASGLITVTTLVDCPAGAGIYGIAQGIIPDSSTPTAVAYTVVA